MQGHRRWSGVGTVTTALSVTVFTLLNATGYVVAQRKAAVASKATGRVEWLGVTEGSRVTEGEIIARLENTDVSATMEQAAANVRVAKANLQHGQAELIDAEAAFNRNRELLDKGFISQFAHDIATSVSQSPGGRPGYSGICWALARQLSRRPVSSGKTLIRAPFDGMAD